MPLKVFVNFPLVQTTVLDAGFFATGVLPVTTISAVMDEGAIVELPIEVAVT